MNVWNRKTILRLGRGVLLALSLAAPALAAPLEDRSPLVQGGPPPDFTLPDTAGRPVRLSDFKGRVIILSFLSCYTDTCFAPLAVFGELLADLGPDRLAAPTICEEISPALKENRYAGLLERCGIGQTILIDETGSVGERFFVSGYPTCLVIGADFTIREILHGVTALRDPALKARIEVLARESAPGAGPR